MDEHFHRRDRFTRKPPPRHGTSHDPLRAIILLLAVLLLLALLAGLLMAAPVPFPPRRLIRLTPNHIPRNCVMLWGVTPYDAVFMVNGNYHCGSDSWGYNGTWSVDAIRGVLRISETVGGSIGGNWMHYEFILDPVTLQGIGIGDTVKGMKFSLKQRR